MLELEGVAVLSENRRVGLGDGIGSRTAGTGRFHVHEGRGRAGIDVHEAIIGVPVARLLPLVTSACGTGGTSLCCCWLLISISFLLCSSCRSSSKVFHSFRATFFIFLIFFFVKEGLQAEVASPRCELYAMQFFVKAVGTASLGGLLYG